MTVLATLSLGIGATGCGGTAVVQPLVPTPSPYLFCADGDDNKAAVTRKAECEAHAAGVKAGTVMGEAVGHEHVTEQTRGGYRLRSAVSMGLGGLAGLIVGTLLGAWVVTRLKRRRAIPHGQHLLSQVASSASAVRKLGQPGPGGDDPVVLSAVQRLGLVVGEVERRAAVVAGQCARLEKKAGDAVDTAHLQGLYGRLDELILLLGRIRIRVNLWIERRLAPDHDAAEAEVAAVLAEMGEAEDDAANVTALDDALEETS